MKQSKPSTARGPAAAGRPPTARPKAAARSGAAPRAKPQAAQAEPDQGQGRRTLKKYPNRRLYDTDSSAYITLADVKQLVMARTPFVVKDAKTQEDLTRSILLQIILEEEAGGAPMFTEDLLSNIIRFYGHAMQGVMGSYLEKNIQTFMELQAKISEQSKGLNPELWAQFIQSQSPLMQGVMGSYVEQSKTLFAQMQEQLQKQSEQMLSSFVLKR
ncbi:MAG: polyhydroxyalkanoate synthesis repressor PhaR [Betaproteobacteria bacterium]